jgi:hypothetical protein
LTGIRKLKEVESLSLKLIVNPETVKGELETMVNKLNFEFDWKVLENENNKVKVKLNFKLTGDISVFRSDYLESIVTDNSGRVSKTVQKIPKQLTPEENFLVATIRAVS